MLAFFYQHHGSVMGKLGFLWVPRKSLSMSQPPSKICGLQTKHTWFILVSYGTVCTISQKKSLDKWFLVWNGNCGKPGTSIHETKGARFIKTTPSSKSYPHRMFYMFRFSMVFIYHSCWAQKIMHPSNPTGRHIHVPRRMAMFSKQILPAFCN